MGKLETGLDDEDVKYARLQEIINEELAQSKINQMYEENLIHISYKTGYSIEELKEFTSEQIDSLLYEGNPYAGEEYVEKVIEAIRNTKF